MPVIETSSELETVSLAEHIAGLSRPGDVILLSGELGAGKSVFARAFIKSLCGQHVEVPSPTFTLVQTYGMNTATVWHFDLYRLEDPDEIFDLGWEEAIASNALALVEWPERLGSLAPATAKRVRIDILNDQTRRIEYDF